MKISYLYFPQWQGSGNDLAIYKGSEQIFNRLESKFSFQSISVTTETGLNDVDGILGKFTIKSQIENQKNIIDGESPFKIFTLGGDCSVDLIPVTYLNQKYNGDLGVIWFDAHGDLNTPESSPSKTFHGMPLRLILGDGDSDFTKLAYPKLNPNQVILAGVRDLDQPEKDFINENQVETVTVDSINNNLLIEKIKKSGRNNLYLHIDLDVIDPNENPFVKCPTINGIFIDDLRVQLNQLILNYNIVGVSFVEAIEMDSTRLQNINNLIAETLKRF